jgi:hypothetical protein
LTPVHANQSVLLERVAFEVKRQLPHYHHLLFANVDGVAVVSIRFIMRENYQFKAGETSKKRLIRGFGVVDGFGIVLLTERVLVVVDWSRFNGEASSTSEMSFASLATGFFFLSLSAFFVSSSSSFFLSSLSCKVKTLTIRSARAPAAAFSSC